MKRLYKSRKNKVIDGVCGGIAEYMEVDPVLVRLVAALLLIFTGGVIFIAYILGMIIMPNRPWEEESAVAEEAPQSQNVPLPNQSGRSGSAGTLIIGAILILLGAHFLLRNIPFFHSYYGWFWDMGWNFLWPSILIAVGLLIVLQARRR
jgi:phage shock protein C